MNPGEKQEKLSELRFGPYITPVVAIGVTLECEVRGLVTVVGVSDAPIPWPLGERDGQQQPIVFKSLARAVRHESPEAVAEAWGVDRHTAEDWRLCCREPLRRKKQTVSSPPIPWKREDDELISRLTLAEAARLTGRTLTAVRKRRRVLGLPDGRAAAQRAVQRDKQSAAAAAAAVARRLLRQRTAELSSSISELRKTYQSVKASMAYWHSQPASPFSSASPLINEHDGAGG